MCPAVLNPVDASVEDELPDDGTDIPSGYPIPDLGRRLMIALGEDPVPRETARIPAWARLR
jgi:hypothetical protein